MAKLLEIRNSTAEFLTFLAENKEDGVQVVYQDENIWATQVAMGELFGVEAKTIGFHLQNIFQEGELQQDRTTQKIGVVQIEGTRKVNREPMFYMRRQSLRSTVSFRIDYSLLTSISSVVECYRNFRLRKNSTHGIIGIRVYFCIHIFLSLSSIFSIA